MAKSIGRDRCHGWANLIVGLKIPRSFIRRLSARKYRKLVAFVNSMWLRVNDNPVHQIKKPRWLSDRYLWREI